MAEPRDHAPLERSLGYRFQDASLLDAALTHGTFVHEHPAAGRENGSLAFLGDAVLGLVAADRLMRDFPGLTKGELTEKRKLLVNNARLAQAAEELGLHDRLALGEGEKRNDAGRETRLATAFEAVVGAIYLDARCVERTFEVVRKLL